MYVCMRGKEILYTWMCMCVYVCVLLVTLYHQSFGITLIAFEVIKVSKIGKLVYQQYNYWISDHACS
jgi:hypothetical protein